MSACGCLWVPMGACGCMAPGPAPPLLWPNSFSHPGEIPPQRVPPTHFDRKEGLKEEAEQELRLLIGKRQRLSPVIQVPQTLMGPWASIPQSSGCCVSKALKGENPLIQDDVQEIKTPGEGLFRADLFAWGVYFQPVGLAGWAFLPIWGKTSAAQMWNLHLLPYLPCISAEPHGLRCCKPAKITALFHSTYEEKKPLTTVNLIITIRSCIFQYTVGRWKFWIFFNQMAYLSLVGIKNCFRIWFLNVKRNIFFWKSSRWNISQCKNFFL